jgi:hypothetical protein
MTDLDAAAREIATKAMKESLAHNGATPSDVSDYKRTINIFSKAIASALQAVREADAQVCMKYGHNGLADIIRKGGT